MTNKERAFLRKISNDLDVVVQVGKGGCTPEVVKSLDEVLTKREIAKVGMLNNCSVDLKELSVILSERTRSEVVHIVGKKIIFYRKSKKNKIKFL